MNTTPKSETSGFLLVDKPEGLSSFDVVRHLRKLTGIRRIGHSGTLDPFATGLLICALGAYTRLLKYLEVQDKSYSAMVKLGIRTDSGDPTGTVVETHDFLLDRERLEALTEAVLGLRKLPIPKHSAVKVNGKRAYSYARQNLELELPERETRISSFQLIKLDPPFLSYSCTVSKGTYIRSLSEYIAAFLSTVGHTVELRRTAIGNINLEDGVSLETLDSMPYQELFYPPQRLLGGYPALITTNEILHSLSHGQIVANQGEDAPVIMVYDQDRQIVAVARREINMLYPIVNLFGAAG